MYTRGNHGGVKMTNQKKPLLNRPYRIGRCVQGQSGKSEWLQPVLSQCHNSESYLLMGLYSSISHFLLISLFVVYGR